MALEEVIIDLVNFGAYAVVLMFGITITRSLYGGKFSSSLPYLVAALFLIFIGSIFHIFVFFWIPVTSSTHIINSSIELLTIIAGILLLSAAYKLYLLKYATSGFMKKLKGGTIL